MQAKARGGGGGLGVMLEGGQRARACTQQKQQQWQLACWQQFQTGEQRGAHATANVWIVQATCAQPNCDTWWHHKHGVRAHLQQALHQLGLHVLQHQIRLKGVVEQVQAAQPVPAEGGGMKSPGLRGVEGWGSR